MVCFRLDYQSMLYFCSYFFCFLRGLGLCRLFDVTEWKRCGLFELSYLNYQIKPLSSTLLTTMFFLYVFIKKYTIPVLLYWPIRTFMVGSALDWITYWYVFLFVSFLLSSRTWVVSFIWCNRVEKVWSVWIELSELSN